MIAPILPPLLVSDATSGAIGGDPMADGSYAEEVQQLLIATFDSLPPAFADAINADRDEFLRLLLPVLELPADYRALIDKTHGLASDYYPADLVNLINFDDYLTLNRTALQLRAVVIPDLLAMAAAAKQEGIVLDISSAFRSYLYQQSLFERHVTQLGREQAERESARAGHSQHQLGTAIDFGSVTPAFAATAAGRWLADNARHYGFSLSYPPQLETLTGYIHESWHYRHLGRAATTLERRFFGGIQQHMLAYLDRHGAKLAMVLLPNE